MDGVDRAMTSAAPAHSIDLPCLCADRLESIDLADAAARADKAAAEIESGRIPDRDGARAATVQAARTAICMAEAAEAARQLLALSGRVQAAGRDCRRGAPRLSAAARQMAALSDSIRTSLREAHSHHKDAIVGLSTAHARAAWRAARDGYDECGV